MKHRIRDPKKLNPKEQRVFDVFDVFDVWAGKPLNLSDVAGRAFTKKGTEPKTHGNSWVRNSLRKLVRLKLVKKCGRGRYRRTGIKLASKPLPVVP
jgi:hypothetical protein